MSLDSAGTKVFNELSLDDVHAWLQGREIASDEARLALQRETAHARRDDVERVTIFVGAGYWFGSYQWVQDYLAVGLAIAVAASAIPGFIIYVVHRVRRRRAS